MDFIQDFFSTVYNVPELVRLAGFYGLMLIVFAETGLLVGFFLPGDSLLITAGLVAATGTLNIWWLNGLLAAAAIAGDSVGYAIGWRAGARLFTRPRSLLFNPRHIERTRAFYERHGAKTIVIARFVPIIRTFAPTVAGAAGMNYRRFALFNIFGGIGWVGSMLFAGWAIRKFFEKTIGADQIGKYLHLIIGVVIFLSMLPGIIEYLRERRRTAREGE